MYDLPELRRPHDLLFSCLRNLLDEAGVGPLPDELDRATELGEHWSSEDLLFSQICGVEVGRHQAGAFEILAAPRFAFPGCEEGGYRSVLLVRGDDAARAPEDLFGRRLAINSWRSHSGCSALIDLFAPLGQSGRFFSDVTVTGAHEHSIRLLRAGEADFAAIDCVTFGLLELHRPGFLDGTRSIGLTGRYPAPPYVTRAGRPPKIVEALKQAWLSTLELPETEQARSALGLAGADLVSSETYERFNQPYETGFAHGYQELSTS